MTTRTDGSGTRCDENSDGHLYRWILLLPLRDGLVKKVLKFQGSTIDIFFTTLQAGNLDQVVDL